MKRDERYIVDWDEAFISGVEQCGGKGWNLSRLYRYGFNVPKGRVLTAAAYQAFVEANGLKEKLQETAAYFRSIDKVDAILVQRLAALRESFQSAFVPEEVVQQVTDFLRETNLINKPIAVRSSASAEDSKEASFAGIHDSYLNVKGLHSVLTAIKNCYASLWSMRALAYRQNMGFADDEVVPSLILMEMIAAEASGVGFSCNPQNGRLDQIVLEANYGLGESMVGGDADPDQYILNYHLEILGKRIGRKQLISIAKQAGGTELVAAPENLKADAQVLNDSKLIELSVLTARVFKALGEGEVQQDVEWAYDGNNFFMLQARPVTGLARYTYPALKSQPDIWSNGNFKDSCPMVFSAFLHRPMVAGVNNLLAVGPKEIGYPALEGRQYCRFFGGRMYLNIALLQWEFFDMLGLSPAEVNTQLGGHQQEIQVPSQTFKQRLKTITNKLKMFQIMMRVRKEAPQLFQGVRRFGKEWQENMLSDLNDKAMVKSLIAVNTAEGSFAKIGLLNSNAAILMDMVVKALKKDFGDKASAMANRLLVGRSILPSAEQGYRLVELAENARQDQSALNYFAAQPFQPLAWEKQLPEDSGFKHKFKEYLADFGHRAVYEADWENPRWREDPSYLLNYIKSIVATADLKKLKTEQQARYKQAIQQYKRTIPFYRRWRIDWVLRQAIKAFELREEGKSEMARLVEPSRYITLAVGQRLKEHGLIADANEVFHCSFPDVFALLLGYWDGTGLSALINDRKQRKLELERLDPPDVIMDGRAINSPAILTENGNKLKGMGVATGRARGKARLRWRPEEGIEQGEILVTPSTDPGWTPLFLKAAGIVMETGGFLSHGATVAREYGIPAVVNIPGVMKVVRDGDSLIVDGDTGEVFRESNL